MEIKVYGLLYLLLLMITTRVKTSCSLKGLLSNIKQIRCTQYCIRRSYRRLKKPSSRFNLNSGWVKPDPHTIAMKNANEIFCDRESTNSMKRLKRKVMIVLGYVGTNYRGLQKMDDEEEANLDKISVEVAIRDALVEAKCIKETNKNDLQGKVGWSRSSRTDKGVHAATILISCKAEIDRSFFDEAETYFTDKKLKFSLQSLPLLRDEINRYLPSDIQVFSCVKINQVNFHLLLPI